PWATLRTNAAGLAEFHVTPRTQQFRQGPWENRQIDLLGGQRITTGGPKMVFDLRAEARDDRGNTAHTAVALSGEPPCANVLLRLDKALYRAGDTLQAEIHTSGGLPTVYLDVVRSGQTLLTRWLDVKDGKAICRLDLPAELFGTLEIHAYQ